MSDPNRSDNWRLEESGDTAGRWKLEEAEQNRISQWALQDDQLPDPSYPEADWQPVEYAREPYQQEGGGGWVLPSLVGLALIAVVAYGVWIGMTQLDPARIGSFLSNPLSSTQEPTAEIAAVAPAQEATATVESAPIAAVPPTATAVATDTPPPPTPTPPVLVEERYVTVIAQYGINARSEPSADAEILRVIEEGEEFLVLDEQPEWLQILSSTGQPAWISSDPQWVEQRTQELTVDAANQARAQLGVSLLPGGSDLPGEDGSPGIASAPTADPVNAAPGITESAPITGGLAPIDDLDGADTSGAALAGTVNITGGLNARSQPDLNGELVALLENGTALTLTGRTEDNGWLSATLENGTPIWVSAQFMAVDGDVAILPVVDGSTAETPLLVAPTATPVPETAEPEAVATDPDGAEDTLADTSGTEEITASVNSLLGAAIRNAPERSADAISDARFENVLTVTGRSIDNEWLQVDLGEEGIGWVLASAVDLSVPLETLPVIAP